MYTGPVSTRYTVFAYDSEVSHVPTVCQVGKQYTEKDGIFHHTEAKNTLEKANNIIPVHEMCSEGVESVSVSDSKLSNIGLVNREMVRTGFYYGYK